MPRHFDVIPSASQRKTPCMQARFWTMLTLPRSPVNKAGKLARGASHSPQAQRFARSILMRPETMAMQPQFQMAPHVQPFACENAVHDKIPDRAVAAGGVVS